MGRCTLFSREVNFFCPILHYKDCLIYQQVNIKIFKKNSSLLQLGSVSFNICIVIDSFCFSQPKRQKLNSSSA